MPLVGRLMNTIMASMPPTLGKRISQAHKEELLDYMAKHPESFSEAIEMMMSGDPKIAWRAAGLIVDLMEDNDIRLRPYIHPILRKLPTGNASEQREWLRLLLHMDIPENMEGQLVDECIRIWIATEKRPGLRYYALKNLIRIAHGYPDLKPELKSLTEAHFLDKLSPGVRRSIERLVREYL
jgi:hypothetical protein